MAPSGARRPRRRLDSPAGRVLPPLTLMAVIFAASHTPDLTTGLGLVDVIGRKVVHAVEYGALWWLWHRALGFRGAGVAAAISLAYAASDEYHQTFVPGRYGTPLDFAIDASGIALAWLADRRFGRPRRLRPAS